MAKALYRKWRPQNWDEVTAQEHVVQTLQNAVMNDRVGHAYLFAGPRGTGKTTTARLLAKAVNCIEPDLAKRPCNECKNCQDLTAGRFLDLIEIDAASNTSVEDVRDLRDKINFSPSQGKFKVYIIDEVHMLSTSAFNALLKTLEEPPPHAIFILATTEIHKIPATVLSRCQRHEFRRIPIQEIVNLLKEKCDEDGFTVPDAVYKEIARQATGSLRDAISLLDQLTSNTNEITLEIAQNVLGTATNMSVVNIINAIIQKDTANGLNQINEALDKGTDPRQLARQIVSYLRNVLLFKMGNKDLVDLTEDIQKQVFDHSNQFSMAELLKAIEAFNQATVDEQASWHPGLGLELAFTALMFVHPNPRDIATTETQQPLSVKDDAASKKIVQEKKPKPVSTHNKPVKKQEKVDQKDKKVEKKERLVEKVEKSDDSLPPTEVETKPVEPLSQSNQTDITINHIQKSWSQIKSKVREYNPRTVGLMNSCKLSGLKDNCLFLGFSSETLKGMMEKEGNLNLISDILTEIMGQSLSVKCIVSTKDSGADAQNLNIDQDGMVNAATRELGGKISKAQQDKP
jgi:DNA polymerase-3 subunit gamma/tau